MTDTTKLADEVDRLAELLESRDLEIAEFHATQLPVAYYMRGYATALRAAPAAEPVAWQTPGPPGFGPNFTAQWQTAEVWRRGDLIVTPLYAAINGPVARSQPAKVSSDDGGVGAGSGAAPIEGLDEAIMLVAQAKEWWDHGTRRRKALMVVLDAIRAYQEAAADAAAYKRLHADAIRINDALHQHDQEAAADPTSHAWKSGYAQAKEESRRPFTRDDARAVWAKHRDLPGSATDVVLDAIMAAVAAAPDELTRVKGERDADAKDAARWRLFVQMPVGAASTPAKEKP